MGGQKKKSGAKSGKHPKYVIPPPSPVRTRSVAASSTAPSKKKKSATATPTLASSTAPVALIASPVESHAQAPSSFSSEISALEDRFEDRMSKMETTIRSSLTQGTVASGSQPSAVSVVAAAAAPAAPLPSAPARGSSRSSSSSSSSSDYRSSSLSSSSSDSDSSRHRRHHRRHKKHRSRTRSSSRRPKHSKYSSARYLREKETVDSYERLVLVNARMALALLRRKKNISSLLKHIILIAEKAVPDVFESAALIGYDESVKEMAKECGMSAFKKVDPPTIVKHLSYDGTKGANAAKKGFASRKVGNVKSFAPASGNKTGCCLKFNFDPRGCTRGKDCFYKHVCSACGGKGHINDSCQNVTKVSPK